jgi:UDPglucose 6-dehydrogenase
MKKITSYFGNNLSGKKIACLGLSFKDNTDDTRESISIKVVRLIRGLGAYVNVYDPEAMVNAKKELGDSNITYCLDLYEALDGADAICILTEWGEFKTLDLDKAKNLLKTPVIFDGRNLLKKKEIEEAGFIYFAVGKKTNGLKQIEEKEKPVYALLRNGKRS